MPKKKKKSRKARGRPGNPRIREIGQSTRFVAGVCPNPGGRPNFSAFSDAIRKIAAANVRMLKITPRDSVSVRIAKKLAQQAMKGSVTAALAMMDRSEGKAPQAISSLSFMRVQADQTQPGAIPADRDSYVLAVREALGFRVHSEPFTATQPLMLTDGKPTKGGTLYDELVQLVKNCPDQQTATMAAMLAAKLKEGNSVQPA